MDTFTGIDTISCLGYSGRKRFERHGRHSCFADWGHCWFRQVSAPILSTAADRLLQPVSIDWAVA
jgi:hypothetical protein